MKPKMRTIGLLGVVAALALAGCGGDDDTPTPRATATRIPATATPADTPTPIVITVAGTPMVVTATPAPTNTPAPTAVVTRKPQGTLNVVDRFGAQNWVLRTIGAPAFQQVGEPLLWWDDIADVPTNLSILESWDFTNNADGSVDWIFKIKNGVKFHKGNGEVTAEDVKFTMTEFQKEASTNGNRDNIGLFSGKDPNNIVVEDALTLRLHSPKSVSLDALRSLSVDTPGVAPFPKKYMEQVGEEGFQKNPVYAGPYEFESEQSGYDVVLRAVPDHFRVTPGFDELHIFNVPEATTSVAMIRTGQLDIASLPASLLEEVESGDVRIAESQFATEVFVVPGGLIPTRPTFDPSYPWVGTDVEGVNPTKVRKALNLAVDRQAIVDKILKGRGEIAIIGFSFINSSYPWWNPAWLPIPFDVPQAKQLLAEAGVPNCFSLEMQFLSNQTYSKSVGEAVAGMWEANLGCKVTRIIGEFRPRLEAALRLRGSEGNGLFWVFDGTPVRRPYRYACWHGGPTYQTIVHTEMPFYTPLCAEARETLDEDELVRIEREIGDMEYKLFPTIPVAYTHATFAVGPKVKSWEPRAKTPRVSNLEFALPN